MSTTYGIPRWHQCATLKLVLGWRHPSTKLTWEELIPRATSLWIYRVLHRIGIPLFCDSQVRNLYELKNKEISTKRSQTCFLLVDMRYTHHLPTVHSVFFPPRWVSRRCARVVFASDSEAIDASVQLFFLLFLVSGRNSSMCCANVFGQAMQWVSISPRPDLGQNSCPSEAVTTGIVRQGGQRAGKLRCTHCEKLECRVVPWEVLHCISGRVDRRLDLCGGCVQVRISR